MLTRSGYMKIIDTTTYFEEKLIMEIRLNILNPFVDRFIVSEARFSHSGKEKEIKFDKKDFPKFQDITPPFLLFLTRSIIPCRTR